METTDPQTIPNAGRVYDYLLGGTHFFESDRQAAEYMLSLLPSTRVWLRRLRRFLHETVAGLAGEGFDHFLDLGSGLPTQEHIHSTAPRARVVYVDNDPVVVSFAKELLGDLARARYLQADIRDLPALLESSEVKAMLGDAARVAIGFNAITCFLEPNEAGRIARTLYEWAPTGSKLFATFETKNPNATTAKMQQFLAMFDGMGSPYHFLTREQSLALMEPWAPEGGGLRPLAEILGEKEEVTDDQGEGVGLEFYGAVFAK